MWAAKPTSPALTAISRFTCLLRCVAVPPARNSPSFQIREEKIGQELKNCSHRCMRVAQQGETHMIVCAPFGMLGHSYDHQPRCAGAKRRALGDSGLGVLREMLL
jgi:hypothetical protein